MTKQDVKTALKCCLSRYGVSACNQCPYKYLILDETPFDCSLKLYLDTIKYLNGDDLISVDMDKVIQDGK